MKGLDDYIVTDNPLSQLLPQPIRAVELGVGSMINIRLTETDDTIWVYLCDWFLAYGGGKAQSGIDLFFSDMDREVLARALAEWSPGSWTGAELITASRGGRGYIVLRFDDGSRMALFPYVSGFNEEEDMVRIFLGDRVHSYSWVKRFTSEVR